MNKLILVGNGFDLAHGLPTSYRDFIDDIWKNLATNHSSPELRKVFELGDDLVRFLLKKNVENFNDFNTLMNNSVSGDISYRQDILFAENKFLRRVLLKVKNDFFILINSKNSIENWVDIENEYYSELKKIVKSNNVTRIKKENVLKLNREFNDIKNLLIRYLKIKIQNVYKLLEVEDLKTFKNLLELFKPNSYFANDFETEEFSLKGDKIYIEKFKEEEKTKGAPIGQTYIVNFNFTDYTFLYQLELEAFKIIASTNSIHGEVKAEGFQPVFGFGDEMDEDYKLIENLDDNEYLRFFKSFQYFQNNCYNGVLEFIEESKFQVCIMGHSCGLSDRVMLNTIFENKNCRSIKVFYHQKEDGTDNYTDLVKNMSRHFKDKPLMRRKIVNKEYSSPLPQNVRFKKIEKKE